MTWKRLDRRHKGYETFKYCETFRTAQLEDFFEKRNWCWVQFGPGIEIDYALKLKKSIKWAWLIDDWRTRIYFATEKEYEWFLLKWMGNEN